MNNMITIVLILSSQLFLLQSSEKLKSILANHCMDCHDEEIRKGDVRFDIDFSKDHQLIEKAFLQLRAGNFRQALGHFRKARDLAVAQAPVARTVHDHARLGNQFIYANLQMPGRLA